jgi:hypothetical protein
MSTPKTQPVAPTVGIWARKPVKTIHQPRYMFLRSLKGRIRALGYVSL